jgi:translation initiation factor 1A
MVKNVTGGSKTKRSARKVVSGNTESSELRMVQEQGESYAVVKKMLGNGVCEVVCDDGKSRQCIIRSKFRGRGKSYNMVDVGKWVMVGIRDWEVRSGDKNEKSDLLHVYSDGDKERLVSKPELNLKVLRDAMKDGSKGATTTIHEGDEDDGVQFSSKAEIAFDNMQSNASIKNNVVLIDTSKQINIDDI